MSEAADLQCLRLWKRAQQIASASRVVGHLEHDAAVGMRAEEFVRGVIFCIRMTGLTFAKRDRIRREHRKSGRGQFGAVVHAFELVRIDLESDRLALSMRMRLM